MEVWTILRNDEKYGELGNRFPVRITASGTAEQAHALADYLTEYFIDTGEGWLDKLFYVEGGGDDSHFQKNEELCR